MACPKETICVGKISAAFGVKGWVKVLSYTNPVENILVYRPWTLLKDGLVREVKLIDGKIQNNSLIVRIDEVSDRDQASGLKEFEICVPKSQLPQTQQGEYYWFDLIGLKVNTIQHENLGVVQSLLETGANDVLIVKGEKEHAIPFLQNRTIITVDLKGGTITVDWDPDF